jgi:hypothetical protein
MRNRRKTIESLRRLAERPGTKHEGEVARQMLERMEGSNSSLKVFDFKLCEFPIGTDVFYNYWAYPKNSRAVVMKGKDGHFKVIEGKTWMRLKFDNLKSPRWVPVTSVKGSHISKTPLSNEDAQYMHYDWHYEKGETSGYPFYV